MISVWCFSLIWSSLYHCFHVWLFNITWLDDGSLFVHFIIIIMIRAQLLSQKYSYMWWVLLSNVPEMSYCIAVSFQVCHVPSGLTPKRTLDPLVSALDDDLHFPQQEKKKQTLVLGQGCCVQSKVHTHLWNKKRGCECCNKGHFVLFTLMWCLPPRCSQNPSATCSGTANHL